MGLRNGKPDYCCPADERIRPEADQGRACYASVAPRTRGDIFIDLTSYEKLKFNLRHIVDA